ncbi:MAG: bacterioferritin [Archangium sp.]|nr:bacterioferritin [Archangium sp.]
MSRSPVALETSSPFILDLEAIKRRARSHIEEGAVTVGYQGDRQQIVKVLNDSLATELVCMLRYRNHGYMSAALGGSAGFVISDELMEHSNEEQAHVDKIAERITQLGGEPDFNPATLVNRSHADYVTSESLRGMLTEDLVAERIAIETYVTIVRFIGDRDPTTRRMFEEILAQEEEHADELADFLKRLPLGG